MKRRATSGRANRRTAEVRQHTSDGDDAATLTPPAYGIHLADGGSRDAAPVQRVDGPSEADGRPNDTGLPHDLKAGLERLSGMSMDSVEVHYDSPRPAEVDALAFTQGTDIHVAPGQEQHLPHEAWHAVQQAQGRVKPTAWEAGTAINDDPGLEREADAMGARLSAATQLGARYTSRPGPRTALSPPRDTDAAIQRKPTARVKAKEIAGILSRLENESLRTELLRVATRLIKDGSLWFDDEINASCAYPDPATGLMMVYIPTRSWWERGDRTVERDAIAIHELTHAAEVVANTGGDFSKLKGDEMESTMIAVGPILTELYKILEKERKDYEAVAIAFESVPYKNLYEFALERIYYVERLVTHSTDPSTREFPTVLNQLVHLIDKKAPTLKSGEFYAWLEILQTQAGQSRETRGPPPKTGKKS